MRTLPLGKKGSFLGLVGLFLGGLLGSTSLRAGPISSTLTRLKDAQPSVRILVEEVPEEQLFRVQYRFPEAVAGFSFLRGRHRYRVTNFRRVTKAEGVWGAFRKKDAILAKDPSRGLREMTLEVPLDTTEREGEYRLHFRSTDGAILFYTGGLEVRALRCPSQKDCPPEEMKRGPALPIHWEFRTRSDRVVSLDRFEAKGRLNWIQPPRGFEVGTYAYFGPRGREKAEAFDWILDPGAPAWMLAMARDLLPKAFARYKEWTGVALDFRPLILVSFSADSAIPQARKGGVLRQVMQVAAEGKGWLPDNPDNRVQWGKFLVHEAFHFWNGEVFRYRLGPSERWLSEGSADYFAFRFLESAGILDKAGFEHQILKASNLCVARLLGRPLVRARGAGSDGRLVYDCGVLLQYLGDQLVRRANSEPMDFRHLFQVLFQRAGLQQGTYSTYDYLELLQEFGHDPLAPAFFEQVLHFGLGPRGEQRVASELTAAGLEFELGPVAGAEGVEGELEGYPSQLLAACDCQGRWSFQRRIDSIEILPLEECHRFRTRTRLSHVGRESLLGKGLEAYDQALRFVDQGEGIPLSGPRQEKIPALVCPAASVRFFPRQLFHTRPGPR